MHVILKKKYGQNFLIDKNILKKITNYISAKSLKIIEIGPGDGRLTENILEHEPSELVIIEIDKDMIPLLNTKFQNHKCIKIVNKDILKYDIPEQIDLIISNLPYNISSQILVKICLLDSLPNNLILMFQKEFAQRLLDKKINSLNSLVNCFYEINKTFNISKNCFRPVPKIDSTVLFFSKKESLLLEKNEKINFIEFKRKLFSHKRKKLKNLIKNFDFEIDRIDLNKRLEDLNIEELLLIFRKTNF